MNRRTAPIAAVLAVLVCGACAPRAGTAPHRSSAAAAPSLPAAAVDLVTVSGGEPARRHLTGSAEEELTRRCMAEAGEAYRPYVVPVPPGDDEHRLVDLAGRRAHGYDLADPAGPPSSGPREKTARFHQALFGDPAADQALTLPNDTVVSFPSNGCVARARGEIFGDVRRWARVDSLPQVIDNDLRAGVRDRPELRAATGRWSACMRSAGFRYADPAAARAAVRVGYAKRGTNPATRHDEIAVAVADGTCDLAVHLTGTELGLRRSAAAALPAAERDELAGLAAIECAATADAAQVLRQPAPSTGC